MMKMTLVKKTGIVLAVLLVLFSIVGFFVVPPVLKAYATSRLSGFLGRHVSIGETSFNPFLLVATVKKITIREKGSKDIFLSVDEIVLDVDGTSLLRRTLTVQELRLLRPYVKIDRLTETTYNISDLFQGSKTAEGKKKEGDESPFRFTVNKIQVSKGSIDFWDGPEETRHAIREIDLNIPFISNIPKHITRDVTPSLSFTLNGSPHRIEGRTKPFAHSLETSFDIVMENLNIPHYFSYLPFTPDFTILSGNLQLKARLTFTQHEAGPFELVVAGDTSLTDLAIVDKKKKPLFSVSTIELTGITAEPMKTVFAVNRIGLDKPQVHGERNAEGLINLIAPFQSGAKQEQPQKRTEGKKTAGNDNFRLDVREFSLTGGAVSFRDFLLEEPAFNSAEKITVKAEHISLTKGNTSPFQVTLSTGRGGTVTVQGDLSLNPFSIKALVDIKNIDLPSLQPYFTENLQLAITKGAVSLRGKTTITESTGGFRGGYTGDLSVARFVSADKFTAEDLLKWDSLFVSNVDLSFAPIRATVKGISLANLYARITINEDKTVNLQEAFSSPENKDRPAIAKNGEARLEKAPAGKVDPPEGTAKPLIKIETVTLQGSRIDFSDESVKPRFSGRLDEIGGRISGLSTEPGTMADIELRGKYDRSAPLEIVGKINPLRNDLYVDLKARFRDMDLSPATPYSGKYVGYTIEKGKLSFDVEYHIEKQKLDSKNVVVLDQLTLGEKVESPDATSLPVRLAIALLKDRKGQIRLDLPVGGRLDDPKFSIGKIVLQILVNILTKAATSPFALLGALFGGGEELGYVEFDYGRASIPQEGLKKLTTLAKALEERPGLTLDIEGHADTEKDREGLKRYLMEQKVKAQKLRDLAKKGAPGGTGEEIAIDPKEYEKYLTIAYKAEKFPKPRNAIGLEKGLPVGEMEKLMMTNTLVKEEDLRGLALRRSTEVKDALLRTGKIDTGRIFTIEARTLAPETRKGARESRVDFRLR